MIDLHSHILAGVDDGARSLEESVEIAAAAVRDGIAVMAATPHVRDDFPTAAATMERLVLELNEALRQKSIPLQVLGGAEIAIPQLLSLTTEELRRFALAGNPHYLLVEFPYLGRPLSLESEIRNFGQRGITLVLAHPERNPEVQLDPGSIEPLVAAGALVQLTAAAVDGRLGRRNKRTAHRLIATECAHLIASDAHWPGLRQVGIGSAAATVDDRQLADWLTREVPAAIVQNDPIPPRPTARKKPSLARRFRR
ncbi:MAG: CpsB/CapC family capsule biosynthesis tyrosine phosphatase [Gaiellaceae bacterium]